VHLRTILFPGETALFVAPFLGDEPASSGRPLMADWREREVGNETRARDINEMEDGILRHLGTTGTNNRYICECSDASCMATVNLTRDEYEQIRGNGVHFVIALDHESPELDLLISEHDGFAVVRKLPGFPARLARASDPRRASRGGGAS
jgi:hypothetical protein